MRVDVFSFTLNIAKEFTNNISIGKEYIDSMTIDRLCEIQENIQRSFVVEEEI